MRRQKHKKVCDVVRAGLGCERCTFVVVLKDWWKCGSAKVEQKKQKCEQRVGSRRLTVWVMHNCVFLPTCKPHWEFTANVAAWLRGCNRQHRNAKRCATTWVLGGQKCATLFDSQNNWRFGQESGCTSARLEQKLKRKTGIRLLIDLLKSHFVYIQAFRTGGI